MTFLRVARVVKEWAGRSTAVHRFRAVETVAGQVVLEHATAKDALDQWSWSGADKSLYPTAFLALLEALRLETGGAPFVGADLTEAAEKLFNCTDLSQAPSHKKTEMRA